MVTLEKAVSHGRQPPRVLVVNKSLHFDPSRPLLGESGASIMQMVVNVIEYHLSIHHMLGFGFSVVCYMEIESGLRPIVLQQSLYKKDHLKQC
jgi:hypothetical protein